MKLTISANMTVLHDAGVHCVILQCDGFAFNRIATISDRKEE